jgi:hypothetical protein
MLAGDQAFYEGMLRRVKRTILILGIAGAVLLGVTRGMRMGGGFFAGAAASYLSFWRWQKVVEALGPAPVSRSAWLLVFRFIALIAAGYVIIKLTGVSLAAALVGLLVAAAAVTIEIVYELIYART